MIFSSDCDAASGNCAKAVEYLQTAIAIRPHSVGAWTRLAFSLEQADPNPRNALRAVGIAQRFGPYDIEPSLAAVQIGLRNWDNLDARQKQDTARALAMVFPNAEQRVVRLTEELDDPPSLDLLLQRAGISESFVAARDSYRKARDRQRELSARRP